MKGSLLASLHRVYPLLLLSLCRLQVQAVCLVGQPLRTEHSPSVLLDNLLLTVQDVNTLAQLTIDH